MRKIEDLQEVFENGSEEDIIEFFRSEDDLQKIKEALDLLKRRKSTFQKKVISKLERVGNSCLTKALDAQSYLAVRSLNAEERKKLEREKNVNFEKAKIFFSLFALS